jgi:hypothetical protein
VSSCKAASPAKNSSRASGSLPLAIMALAGAWTATRVARDGAGVNKGNVVCFVWVDLFGSLVMACRALDPGVGRR